MGKQFPTYTVCHYQIFNPSPNRTLYLNIYRETNLTDIGVYYERSEVNQQEIFDNVQLAEHGELAQNVTQEEMEAARQDGKIQTKWTQVSQRGSSAEGSESRYETLEILYPTASSFYQEVQAPDVAHPAGGKS